MQPAVCKSLSHLRKGLESPPFRMRPRNNDGAQYSGPSNRCLHTHALHRQPGRRRAECRRARRCADARHCARAQQRRYRVHSLGRWTDHDLRARFFTPRTEAGFVGHATVAAHYVLSRRRGGTDACGKNPRPASSTSRSAARAMSAGSPSARARPRMGRELNDRERLAVLDALALATDDLDDRCPLRIVGAEQHAPYGRRARAGAAETAEARPGRLNTLSAQLGAAGYFVFTLAPARRATVSPSHACSVRRWASRRIR